ncbi:MAG: acyltransferase [Terracidiphilus sp.]
MNELEVREKPSADPLPRLNRPKGSGSVHLDALRGVAALMVLLYHWRLAFFQDYSKLAHHNFFLSLAYIVTGLGHQAVMVFFVLSGYLVGGSVLRAANAGQWSWRDYLLTRLTRLYIVLLPALVLGAALDWAGTHFTGQNTIYGPNGRAGSVMLTVNETLNPRAFVENAVFLQSFPLPDDRLHQFPTFGSNVPLWSLSYEFWYYIGFPFIVLALSRKTSWFAKLVYFVLLLAWSWFVGLTVLVYSIPWLLGVAIRTLPPFPSRRSWARRGALTVALAMLILGFVAGSLVNPWLQDIFIGECTAALIWISVSGTAVPLVGWYGRMAHGAAKNSYTLYLLHLPFLVFLKAALHVPQFLPSWLTLLPALGILALILAYVRLVYLLFERHTDDLRIWLKQRLAGRQRVTTNAASHAAN